MKKKSYIEKLGLDPVEKLTKKVCLERSRLLRARLSKDAYDGRLRKQAVYYASWYKWRATHKPKAS